MSHTPGPWTYRPAGNFKYPIVQRGDEGGFTVSGMSASRQEADARLIAAAPNLLEACETLLFELVAGPAARDEVIANARAAIAKATGDAQ